MTDLILAYGIVIVALGAGLYRGRALGARYVSAPLVAIVLVLIGGAL